MTMRPIDDKIAVRPDEAQKETEGGIILPDNAQKRPVKGTVLAIGPGKPLADGTRFPMTVKVGDRVSYSKYAGSEIETETGTVVVIHEHDVHMVE